MGGAVATIIGGVLLVLGALNGWLSWTVDTCTQNSPDAPYAGYFTFALNIAGWALVGWRAGWAGAICAGVLPTIAAGFYTDKAWSLIGGAAACSVLTGDGHWPDSGDEPALTLLWSLTAFSFWAGLAWALWRAYRRSPSIDADLA